jgi:hypothetical protein
MIYIDFTPLYARVTNHWKRSKEIDSIRNWLEENVGDEEIDWIWNRGDLFARGVTIYNNQSATVFRLRFGL